MKYLPSSKQVLAKLFSTRGLRSFLLSWAVLVVAAAAATANAAITTYTFDGGSSTVDGTLGAISFTNATFKFMATADSANAQYSTDPVPNYSILATVSLEITDGANVYTATFLETMRVVSFDKNQDSAGLGAAGFAGNVGGFLGVITGGTYGGTPGIFNNLATPGTWTGLGSVVSQTYSTDAGAFQMSNQTNAYDATWTISGSASVPEPTSLAIFGVGAICVAFGARRKLKTATPS